jgi:transcriptional regulator with XRE-family HTH domain
MPTGKQIRAARVLADWDAGELAERVGMSRVSIQNIEREDSRPKTETMDKIVQAFFDVGIEFTDNQGVRMTPTTVNTYIGPERFDKFYNFLYDHMLDHGGEVCLSVVDEGLLAKYRKNPEVQRQRMRELVKSGQVTYRVLVTEGDFTGDYVEYRQQPAHAAAPTAFYAFGECLALISFPQDQSPHVVVIRSEPLAQAYRQSFHAAWEKAKPLSANDIKKQKQQRKD